MLRQLVGLTLSLSLLTVPAGAQARNAATDSAAVVAAAEKFHAALAAGLEDRAHYREHHLPGDIRFAMSASSKRAIGQVTVRGDVAWLVSTSTTTGESGGRAVNSQGAELMVLVRTPQGWKIAAVHWSSRRRG